MASPELPELDRTIVLVGLMGAGKSCVGRRLAKMLGLPFVDADDEIEEAAGCSIPEIFELYGEAEFRDGERRVMARLLDGGPQVLATGGGAFLNPETRATIRERGISVWLRADLETLLARTSRRTDRPLLRNGDPRETLSALIEERYPIYAKADITVDTGDGSSAATARAVLDALRRHLNHAAAEHAGEKAAT